jgi:hypothetical protein
MPKRLVPLFLAALTAVLLPQPATAQEAIPGVYGPVVRRGITFYLRYAMTTGVAEDQIPFGDPGDRPLLCDWDGSGFRQLGVHRGSTFYLEVGVDVLTVPYGNVGDQPLCGDWDGDGVETIGVRRGNQWFLSDDDIINTGGAAAADHTFFYGDAGDQGFVGDFDGDGMATPGVRRGITFYLSNNLNGGNASLPSFPYGDPGDIPVFADWDGGSSLSETAGVFRNGQWFYKISNTGGIGDGQFLYGSPGDVPLVYREDA